MRGAAVVRQRAVKALQQGQGAAGVALIAGGVGVLASWPWALIVLGVALVLAAGFASFLGDR